MENEHLLQFIEKCNDELINNNPVLYEAYFLKIYVAFENYLGEIFVKYCLGQMSENGYKPKRRLEFEDIEQLKNVLEAGKKLNYIDYIEKIKTLSQDIFKENPFSILLEDAENVTLFNQMTLLRNCIAHESDFSKKKYRESCLGSKDYISPGEFLMSLNKKKSKSYYSIYIEKIISISSGLLAPMMD